MVEVTGLRPCVGEGCGPFRLLGSGVYRSRVALRRLSGCWDWQQGTSVHLSGGPAADSAESVTRSVTRFDKRSYSLLPYRIVITPAPLTQYQCRICTGRLSVRYREQQQQLYCSHSLYFIRVVGTAFTCGQWLLSLRICRRNWAQVSAPTFGLKPPIAQWKIRVKFRSKPLSIPPDFSLGASCADQA